MNQKTKEMISTNRLLERPVYTEEDLKILADHLQHTEDPKAFKVINQLIALNHDPLLFEGWTEQTNADYDYWAIFFGASMDNLPLIINEDLDGIEDIVLRWRLERSK
jgi:hypothetical protein